MTAARRCRQIAPDHPSAHGPPGRASAPVPGDHPSAHAPRDDDAMPAQGPGGSDAATEQGAPASAVYDPQARAFYDAETGALLADEAAWERASEDQRDKARARLAAVRRAEDLIALGIPRREADAAAAKEAGIASGVLGRWRRKVRGLPKGARGAALLDARRPGRPSKIDAENGALVTVRSAMRREVEGVREAAARGGEAAAATWQKIAIRPAIRGGVARAKTRPRSRPVRRRGATLPAPNPIES